LALLLFIDNKFLFLTFSLLKILFIFLLFNFLGLFGLLLHHVSCPPIIDKYEANILN
jgi:hypothetical protein